MISGSRVNASRARAMARCSSPWFIATCARTALNSQTIRAQSCSEQLRCNASSPALNQRST